MGNKGAGSGAQAMELRDWQFPWGNKDVRETSLLTGSLAVLWAG